MIQSGVRKLRNLTTIVSDDDLVPGILDGERSVLSHETQPALIVGRLHLVRGGMIP